MSGQAQRAVEDQGSWWQRWSSYLEANARRGVLRARGAAVPVVQTAISATIAWLVCHWLLDDPNPIFAPIATFVCLGISRNREPRKVAEMGLGASTGVLIGGLLGHYFGFGAWQLLFLLLLAPLLGRLIDRSEMVAFQIAVQSIVVASMVSQAASESPFDRWLNALIGAGVALLATVVLPSNVVTRPKRYVTFTIEEVARTLRGLSKGLLDGDGDAISQLHGRLLAMRELLNDGSRSLASAQETAAISPAAFSSRSTLAELDRMLELCERLHVTLSMMQRQSRGMVTEIGPMPEIARAMWQAADLMDQIARGVRNWQRPTAARDATAALAAELGPADVIVADADWRSATLMSLLRAVVVDMLELTGLSLAQARAVLADTGIFNPGVVLESGPGVEQASMVWGTEELPAVESASTPDEPPAQADGQGRGPGGSPTST